MALVLLLALFLTVWNNVVNVWAGFQRWYTPINLGLVVVVVAAARWQGLSWQAMGFAPEHPGAGLAWGLAAFVVVAVFLAVAYAWPKSRPILRDGRVADHDGARLAFVALIRIPLGTVVLEEIAFRGVLFGAWMQEQSVLAAVIGSSIMFGLWHITPTIVLYNLDHEGVSVRARVIAAATGVALTTVAGVVLCLLRLAGDGLIAPLMAHTASNSLGLVAAFLAHRADRGYVSGTDRAGSRR